VPADYQRRQTLTGAERYVTPALKEFEEKVMHATERIEALERQLFEALRAQVGAAIARLQAVAGARGARSTCCRRSPKWRRARATCALVDDGDDAGDRARAASGGGAHDAARPVHSQRRRAHARRADDHPHRPEHGRQEHHPAADRAARADGADGELRAGGVGALGVADRVFTRVGASDNLVRGQSTFMVEMSETSAILHTATARSLVLLDEIGRGTATWDGVSIAWAVSEHLHERVGCKTVFATHYHELTQLAEEFVSVRNYNVAVQEVGERSCSCTGCSPAAPTGRTASRWGAWPDCRRR
jgi:DNA mismatch repair protein MutS